MDIALATYARLPDLDDDERLLVPALAARGLRAAPVLWDDRAFDWSSVRACVIRSTWDYHHRRDDFLAWAERVSRATRLFNALVTVRWNTHKRYLSDLEERGVRIVPTEWITRGARAPTNLRALLERRGWRDAVVKPAVSGGAQRTMRVQPASDERAGADAMRDAQALLDSITQSGDAMVQPYLASVETRGERSLVFFDGAFSHAVRKHAQLPDVGASKIREGGEGGVVAAADDVRFAESVLTAARDLAGDVLYARVDIANDDADGGLRLMELEVTEPSLFLGRAADGRGADRFADAIARRLRRV